MWTMCLQIAPGSRTLMSLQDLCYLEYQLVSQFLPSEKVCEWNTGKKECNLAHFEHNVVISNMDLQFLLLNDDHLWPVCVLVVFSREEVSKSFQVRHTYDRVALRYAWPHELAMTGAQFCSLRAVPGAHCFRHAFNFGAEACSGTCWEPGEYLFSASLDSSYLWQIHDD